MPGWAFACPANSSGGGNWRVSCNRAESASLPSFGAASVMTSSPSSSWTSHPRPRRGVHRRRGGGSFRVLRCQREDGDDGLLEGLVDEAGRRCVPVSYTHL